ncbi:MAG: uracil-DNA glycosylase [Spirochaetales bacterium]|nr:MAG: uracil-DNA glycosylase [Spirochaetales bacterium]
MKNTAQQFWELLYLFEDYLTGGYEQQREVPLLSLPGDACCDEKKACFSEAADEMKILEKEILTCRKCGLCGTRHLAVPGEGVLCPSVVVIGEGPGAEEDRTGRPFVGAAGKYLDKWLSAIDGDRNTNCYICNLVKCRPPGNRDPEEDEIEACLTYLVRQLDLLKPKVILAAGRIASQRLTGLDSGIGILRGKVYDFKGIPVVPTYHPSAVLRNQDLRRPVWEDLKQLQILLSGR